MQSEIDIVPGGFGKATVQHLPAKISMDGPTKVKTYFVQAEDASGGLNATFRGRLLEGHCVPLPAGVVGLVLHDAAPAQQQSAGHAHTEGHSLFAAAGGASAASRSRSSGVAHTAAGPKGYGKKAAVVEDDEDDEDEDADVGFTVESEEEDDEDKEEGGGGAGRESTYSRAASGAGMNSGLSGTAAAGEPEGPPAPRRAWRVEASFDSITYWNHDKPGSDKDMVRSAADWFSLARAIHDPVPA